MRLVILDFDGTMTDAEAEGRPFVQGYLEDLAALTGRGLPEIQALAGQYEAEVMASPHAHGWLWKGAIVAPATVDPYVRIMPVARKILDACGAFEREEERERLLDAILFKYNYAKTVRAFRPHAAQALAALEAYETWVVTNAHVEPVKAKIADLEALQGAGSLRWLMDRVIGRAMKQVVEDADTSIPRELRLPGLERAVLVRRPFYKEVLQRLKGNRPWDEVTVVGDIFELDLSLPLVLGARVVLTANAFTPSWEREFVASHPRARLVEDLRDLPRAIAEP